MRLTIWHVHRQLNRLEIKDNVLFNAIVLSASHRESVWHLHWWICHFVVALWKAALKRSSVPLLAALTTCSSRLSRLEPQDKLHLCIPNATLRTTLRGSWALRDGCVQHFICPWINWGWWCGCASKSVNFKLWVIVTIKGEGTFLKLWTVSKDLFLIRMSILSRGSQSSDELWSAVPVSST